MATACSPYDANGNIRSLNRKGFKLGGSTYIDQLNYGYLNTNASNKLNAVVDAANDTLPDGCYRVFLRGAQNFKSPIVTV